MPSSEQYGATPEEIEKYGANVSIWDAVRLFQRFAPLVGFVKDFVATPDPYRKSLIVSDACEWLASQTASTVDDQFVKRLADVLKTKEGEALLLFVLLQVEAVR